MTQPEKSLIKIQTIFFFTSALAAIFLNVFLFKISGLKTLIIFQSISLTTLLFWYILSGWLFKKWQSRFFMKLSFLAFFTFYFLLFILREKSLNFLLLLGLIQGTGDGLFWSANNLAQYVSTYKETRLKFFGRQNFWLYNAYALGPLAGGLIISSSKPVSSSGNLGYLLIFLFVSLLMVYLFFLTDQTPSFSGIKFSLKDILTHRRTHNWKIVLIQQGLEGLGDRIFATLSVVLIYLIVKEEVILGSLNTLNYLIFALASIIASKQLRKSRNFSILGTIFSPLGLLFFAWQQNWLGIFSLLFIHTLFSTYLKIPIASLIYDEIDEIKKSWQEKYHFLIERDAVLAIFRILTHLILLCFFVGAADQISIARHWIYIIPIFPLLTGLSFFFLKKPGRHNSI